MPPRSNGRNGSSFAQSPFVAGRNAAILAEQEAGKIRADEARRIEAGATANATRAGQDLGYQLPAGATGGVGGTPLPGQSAANRDAIARSVSAGNAGGHMAPNTPLHYVPPGTPYSGPSTAPTPGPGSGATQPIRIDNSLPPHPGQNASDKQKADWADAVVARNKEIASPHDAPAPVKPVYGPSSTKGQPATPADIAALNAAETAPIRAVAGTGNQVITPFGPVSSTDASRPKDYALAPGANGGVVPSLAAQQEILAKYPQLADPKSPMHAAFLKAWSVATEGKKAGDVLDNHLAIAENAATAPGNPEGAGKRAGIAERPDSSDKGTPGKDIAKATPAPAAPSAAAQVGESVGAVPGAVSDTVKNYWDAAKDAVGAVGGAVKEFGEGVTGNAGGGARPNAQMQGGDTAMTPEERAAWGGNTPALPVAKEQTPQTTDTASSPGSVPTGRPQTSQSSITHPVPLPTYDLPQFTPPTIRPVGPTGMMTGPMSVSTFTATRPPPPIQTQQPQKPPDQTPATATYAPPTKNTQSPLNGGNDLVGPTGAIPGAAAGAGTMIGKGESWDAYDARQGAKGAQSPLNGGNDLSGAHADIHAATVAAINAAGKNAHAAVNAPPVYQPPSAALNPTGNNSATAIPSGGLGNQHDFSPTESAALKANGSSNQAAGALQGAASPAAGGGAYQVPGQVANGM